MASSDVRAGARVPIRIEGFDDVSAALFRLESKVDTNDASVSSLARQIEELQKEEHCSSEFRGRCMVRVEQLEQRIFVAEQVVVVVSELKDCIVAQGDRIEQLAVSVARQGQESVELGRQTNEILLNTQRAMVDAMSFASDQRDAIEKAAHKDRETAHKDREEAKAKIESLASKVAIPGTVYKSAAWLALGMSVLAAFALSQVIFPAWHHRSDEAIQAAKEKIFHE